MTTINLKLLMSLVSKLIVVGVTITFISACKGKGEESGSAPSDAGISPAPVNEDPTPLATPVITNYPCCF